MIYQINLQISNKFDSLKSLGLSKDNYRPAAKAIMQWKDSELKKALTIGQYDDYVLMKDEKFEVYKKKQKAEREKRLLMDSVVSIPK
jgi:uncharacterized protein (DUF4213/DUF364 family)